jgi:hypothetical protein
MKGNNMKQNYVAITEHGAIFLGKHLDREDALNDAVDRFNIHQAKNYLIVNDDEASSIFSELSWLRFDHA